MIKKSAFAGIVQNGKQSLNWEKTAAAAAAVLSMPHFSYFLFLFCCTRSFKTASMFGMFCSVENDFRFSEQ